MKLTKLLSILILGLGLCLSSCTDPCDDVACLNGGACAEGDCSCPNGFSGDNCAIEDFCVTQPINCLNGGTCLNGGCDCPTGYTGTNCESLNITEVQALLDAGETPLALYNNGVPLAGLYGKTYQGGFIFYLNTGTGKGFVAATSNVSSGGWGCMGTNTGAWNVTSDPPTFGAETAVGARIGDGKTNTDAILSSCGASTAAAARCRALGSAWFLPSRGELKLMYTNLHLNGHGNFSSGFYWSSTEYNSDRAWDQSFSSGNQNDYAKTDQDRARAAKAF